MVKYKRTFIRRFVILFKFFNENTRTYDLFILSGWRSALYFERNEVLLYVVAVIFILNIFLWLFFCCCRLLFFFFTGIRKLKNRMAKTDTSSFNLIESVRNIIERKTRYVCVCVCFAVCRLSHSGMYLLHNSSISPSLSKWSSRKQS